MACLCNSRHLKFESVFRTKYGQQSRGNIYITGLGLSLYLSLSKCLGNRVSSKHSNFFFRFELKQNETQSVSVVFRFVLRNQKKFFSVCSGLFRCFGPVLKQQKKTSFGSSFGCFDTKLVSEDTLLGKFPCYDNLCPFLRVQVVHCPTRLLPFEQWWASYF